MKFKHGLLCHYHNPKDAVRRTQDSSVISSQSGSVPVPLSSSFTTNARLCNELIIIADQIARMLLNVRPVCLPRSQMWHYCYNKIETTVFKKDKQDQ